MRLLSLKLLTALIFLTVIAHAEEKSEEGGKTGPAPLPKDQKEYIDKTSRLTSLTNRIAEYHKQFAEAVHKKNTAKTSMEKQRWIKSMNDITAQLNKDVENYERIRSDLKLRYPNQGELIERRYKTQTKKSVEEMEGVAGLDEKLTQVKKVIDKKYEPFLIEEEKKSPASPPPTHSTAEEKPTRLRLEK